MAGSGKSTRASWRGRRVLSQRGRVRASRGEYDLAVSDFNACLRLEPNNAIALFTRALAWGEKREYYRGIRDLDRGLRIELRAAEAYRIRGMYWLTLNNVDRAGGFRRICQARRFRQGAYVPRIGLDSEFENVPR